MAWHKSLFDVVDKAKNSGVVLYGAGAWGKLTLDILSSFGVAPICFADDDKRKQDETYYGYKVLSLEECSICFPDAIYIICIAQTNQITSYVNMMEKLKKYSVYKTESEIRIPFYYFYLDLHMDSVKQSVPSLEEMDFSIDDIVNICLFYNMSNSGSYYLEQRLDGHPNLLFVPYLPSLETVYKKRLSTLCGDELIIEIMAQLLGYYNTEHERLTSIDNYRFGQFVVDEKGSFIDKLLINPDDFYIRLKQQFKNREIKLNSYGDLIKVIWAAYNNVIGKRKDKNIEYWAFYNVHVPNADLQSAKQLFEKHEFKTIKSLMIIREPLQHIFSWINLVIKGKSTKSVRRAVIRDVFSCDLGLCLENDSIDNEDVAVIRFEDLKLNSSNTMQALCNWIGITYYPQIMDKTTTNGIEVYFVSATSSKRITGNDTTAVKRTDFSDVLTESDCFCLNMFCGNMKRAYGYECDAPELNNIKKEELIEMARHRFMFASIVNAFIEEKSPVIEQYDVNDLIFDLIYEYIDKHYGKKFRYYERIIPIN